MKRSKKMAVEITFDPIDAKLYERNVAELSEILYRLACQLDLKDSLPSVGPGSSP